jgi:hypothetical protein
MDASGNIPYEFPQFALPSSSEDAFDTNMKSRGNKPVEMSRKQLLSARPQKLLEFDFDLQ